MYEALWRRPSIEADDDISSAFPEFAASTHPADAGPAAASPQGSGFTPRPEMPEYPRPPFPPAFDAHYQGAMGLPSRSPLMPQPIYPAPPPYPPQQAGYPQAQPWQAPSQAAYPYAQPSYDGHVPYPLQPVAPQQQAYPDRPMAQPVPPIEENVEQAPIEEIRASLREFREAVRELTESRARRRYF